jgi:hypothetical protein
MSDFIRQHQKNSLKGVLGYDQPGDPQSQPQGMMASGFGQEPQQPYASGLRSMQGSMDGSPIMQMFPQDDYDMALASMKAKLMEGRT